LQGTTSDPLTRTTQGTSIVTWTFTDAVGNTSTQTQKIVVKDNQIPIIYSNGNKNLITDLNACGATVVVSASVTDNCSVGSSIGVRSDSLALTALYPVGTTTITWNVIDANGNAATPVVQTVIVTNNAPAITSITPSNISLSPIALGTSASLNFVYADNNVTSAVINWDDATSITVTNPANIFTLSHTYATPGVYTVTLVLTDACGITTSSKYDYIVVYDPNGGFVTGGGWINSPPGAWVGNPTLIGKANFGFVAKYKKGSTVPDGNTEFQFKEGNLNFNSSSYDDMRLVISGTKANYKGVGKINGSGNYGFLVSAIDGGAGADKFRIKIWNKDNGNAVVYDNNMGNDENDLPTTVLGGGSIVIHEVKKNAKIKVELVEKTTELVPFNVMAYPNPSSQYFTIEMKGNSNEKVEVVVYDVLGRMVKHIEKSDGQEIKLGEEFPSGAYIAIINQGINQKTIRLIKE
ncbi:T9SS type A sorting domain-containing protein, partial [Flavobacterium sp. XS2P39]|uniref:T9SS type A sorting domain-containing protein n=1 Tax=Flavobacterium sp. XS2P39 TaxID=3401725 RepID=UPI003AAAEE4A